MNFVEKKFGIRSHSRRAEGLPQTALLAYFVLKGENRIPVDNLGIDVGQLKGSVIVFHAVDDLNGQTLSRQACLHVSGSDNPLDTRVLPAPVIASHKNPVWDTVSVLREIALQKVCDIVAGADERIRKYIQRI